MSMDEQGRFLGGFRLTRKHGMDKTTQITLMVIKSLETGSEFNVNTFILNNGALDIW